MPSNRGITPVMNWARKHARVRDNYLTEGIAEFIGCLILCLFTTAAGAQSLIMGPETHMMPVFGGILGIMIAITVTGGSSGAHINPAVTLGVALSGHLSWFKVPVYWSFQLAGCYVGSGISYGIYKAQLEKKLQFPDLTKVPAVSGIFAHFAGLQHNSFTSVGISDQAVTTAVLLMAVLAAGDPRNMGVPKWFAGPFFGLVVAGVNFAFGVIGGGSMNPARDIGPRLMALTIGWKSDDVFMYSTCVCNPGPCEAAETDSCDPQNIEYRHYWLVPVIGPFVGAAIGTLIYIFFIAAHLPDTKEELETEENNNKGYDWKPTHIPKVTIEPDTLPTIPKQYTTGAGRGTHPAYTNGSVPNGVINQVYVNGMHQPQAS